MSYGCCYEISTDPCLYPIGLLTPDEVANDNAETMSLSQIINDETKLVYFDSTYYTVDKFIREVMPDTRYFVAKDNALIID